MTSRRLLVRTGRANSSPWEVTSNNFRSRPISTTTARGALEPPPALQTRVWMIKWIGAAVVDQIPAPAGPGFYSRLPLRQFCRPGSCLAPPGRLQNPRAVVVFVFSASFVWRSCRPLCGSGCSVPRFSIINSSLVGFEVGDKGRGSGFCPAGSWERDSVWCSTDAGISSGVLPIMSREV